MEALMLSEEIFVVPLMIALFPGGIGCFSGGIILRSRLLFFVHRLFKSADTFAESLAEFGQLFLDQK
jgi:hypothetical protein